MGRATILGGGPDGRYTVELNTGEEQRLALVEAATTIVGKLTTKLSEDLAELAVEEAKVAAARAVLASAIDAYVLASQGDNQAAKDDALLTYVQAQKLVLFAEGQAGGIRRRVGLVRLKLRQAQGRLAYWQNLSLLETRQAWCADLTEDAPAGVEVATIEIPGESNLVLIKPGAPAHNLEVDGDMVAREIMSPEQVYLNAALLPGWQKYKPTFRRGTITALDTEADTASVTLAEATSSAQRLDVNQATTLTDVPVTYMGCNASAFEVGDQAVVMFDDQDWSSPRVIGFVTDPKGCGWYAYSANYPPHQSTYFQTRNMRSILLATRSSAIADKLFQPSDAILVEFRSEYFPDEWKSESKPEDCGFSAWNIDGGSFIKGFLTNSYSSYFFPHTTISASFSKLAWSNLEHITIPWPGYPIEFYATNAGLPGYIPSPVINGLWYASSPIAPAHLPGMVWPSSFDFGYRIVRPAGYDTYEIPAPPEGSVCALLVYMRPPVRYGGFSVDVPSPTAWVEMRLRVAGQTILHAAWKDNAIKIKDGKIHESAVGVTELVHEFYEP